jgi:hypothetical protein
VCAFDQLGLNGRKAPNSEANPVLEACVVGERLARTFPLRLLKEQQILADSDADLKMVDRLTAIVRECESQRAVSFAVREPGGLWLSMVRLDPAKFSAMYDNLTLIAALVEGRRQAASNCDVSLGITRKSRGKTGGQNAAILKIAQAVRRVTGRPHTRQVAEIAGAVLRIFVSDDRVINVVREHTGERSKCRRRIWERKGEPKK